MIISTDINTKIAPIHVKKSGKEPKITKPKKDAKTNWVKHTGCMIDKSDNL